MFCPKCGKKDVVDVFCASCLKEEKPLVASFKEFKAEICTKSKAIKFRGKWHQNENPEEKLGELFTSLLQFPNYAEIEGVSITIPPITLKDGLKVAGEAIVRVTGRNSEKAKFYDEEYIVPFEVQNTLSPRRAKEGTSYFEGTIQVRNETAEVKKFFLDTLHHYGASVAKESKEKHGTDYFVTRKAALSKTARALIDKYGGLLKSSAHLFGRDKMRSKDVYRETWFVEVSPFARGDAIKKGKQLLFIVESGKKIKCLNPERGKFEFHEYEQDWKRVAVHETTIAATHPAVTAIHPETFQAVKIENPRIDHEPSEKVKVAIDGKKLYRVQLRK